MSTTDFGVDLAQRRADRTYPVFGPHDDDFHDEVLSDRWWETETAWFSWNVPERAMGGWLYCQARPNARLCNGGAWVWDAAAAYPWELAYRAEYSGLELPPRAARDLRDFEWPTGVRVRVLEPTMRYRVTYADPGALEVDLVFDGLMAPNPHPAGVVPFVKGTHFDQPGHVTGTVVLHGETIHVDCFSFRDRSWGPRPLGRPTPRTDGSARPAFGGVGYCFGAAGPRDAWLVYAVPGPAVEPVPCGFLLRDGEYGHVLAGERRVSFDPATGWPVHISIEAVDDRDRHLSVAGDAVSRHWRGHGGDSLVRWTWDGRRGWGEDQSYFTRSQWEENRRRGAR
ncbi:MAG TPA: hypothetical protein VL961_13200 [Acidimicrobiales bacterium]|nr:hypothetical protein [Acidimicrobiales bacterium]